MSAAARRLMSAAGKRNLGSDDFNRADSSSSMGTSTSGHLWTPRQDTWGIQTNRAYCVSTAGGAVNELVGAGAADCAISVKLATRGSAAAEIVARMTDNNNYLIFGIAGGNAIEMYRKVAGSYTQIAYMGPGTTGNFFTFDGDILTFVLSGSSVIGKINGTQFLTATETFNQTATKVGLRTDGTSVRFDDFSVS